MGQIVAADPDPGFLVALLIGVDQEQQRDESFLVVLRAQQLEPVRQGEIAVAAHDGPGGGDTDAQEDVALAILAGTGLEETLEKDGVARVGRGLNVGPDPGEGGSHQRKYHPVVSLEQPLLTA
jgi:hypothetical protein